MGELLYPYYELKLSNNLKQGIQIKEISEKINKYSKNAEMQPFKYLCKYFNIKSDEESLESFENVLNNFSAAEDGKQLLSNEIEKIK